MQKENSALIKLESVGLTYPGRTVLEDLSLEVRAGEVLGVLGRIGAGKTRILRLLSGLEIPTRGRIVFGAGVKAEHLGYAFQGESLIPWLTVRENLRLVRKKHTEDPLESRPVVKEAGLFHMLDLKPFQLSGGMRKKVNLARAFMNEDPLVLLDEPFSALDPAQKIDMQNLFLRFQQRTKATALVVTHDIQEALSVCDRISFLTTRQRRISRTFENPFRGAEDAALTTPEYKKLYREILDLYLREGAEA